MLILHRRKDESFVLFDKISKQCIRVVLVDTARGSCRIGIQGCESMQVVREELLLGDRVEPKYREAANVYKQCYEDID